MSHAATSLVATLSHDLNKDSMASLFSVGESEVTKFRWERSKGIFLNPDVNFTQGALAQKWDSIHDFSEKVYSTSAMDYGKLLPEMQQLLPNPQLLSTNFSGQVVLITGGASG